MNPAASLANPFLLFPSGALTLPQQQQEQAAAFLTQNFDLQNFLLQPPGGQVRLPGSQPPVVVSSAGGLSPQNASLLQSQLAAQRVLLQQQQQQHAFTLASDPASLALGLPTPSYLPPLSAASAQIPSTGYASTAPPTLPTSGAPKRSFDQAFVAGSGSAAATSGAAAGKRANYGYGALAGSPVPTISAGPTTYYATTPNPT
jgi:hypothetical protein